LSPLFLSYLPLPFCNLESGIQFCFSLSLSLSLSLADLPDTHTHTHTHYRPWLLTSFVGQTLAKIVTVSVGEAASDVGILEIQLRLNAWVFVTEVIVDQELASDRRTLHGKVDDAGLALVQQVH
jgi:hypothetical protein